MCWTRFSRPKTKSTSCTTMYARQMCRFCESLWCVSRRVSTTHLSILSTRNSTESSARIPTPAGGPRGETSDGLGTGGLDGTVGPTGTSGLGSRCPTRTDDERCFPSPVSSVLYWWPRIDLRLWDFSDFCTSCWNVSYFSGFYDLNWSVHVKNHGRRHLTRAQVVTFLHGRRDEGKILGVLPLVLKVRTERTKGRHVMTRSGVGGTSPLYSSNTTFGTPRGPPRLRPLTKPQLLFSY